MHLENISFYLKTILVIENGVQNRPSKRFTKLGIFMFVLSLMFFETFKCSF